MKKLLPIAVVGVVIVLVLGYLGRHKIKALLGMAPAAPAVTYSSPTTNSNAPSNNIYMSKTDPAKGAYMTDFAGMTLYVFDKDTSGVSNCYGGCANIWP